jgi:hypothetical protein
MCIGLSGSIAAVGSFCWRLLLPSPPAAGVVAVLLQSAIVASVPLS